MARLYALLAREARNAVIFRRGPSKQVLLLGWDLRTDRLREGQWLKGRIYERRCDLSPSGELLVYFAANHRPPYGTWTALSRPPWLTALALWPNGSTWGGGGLFVSDKEIELNQGPPYGEPAQGKVPRGIDVHAAKLWRGEDGPILDRRLRRDGWKLDGNVRTRPSPKGRASLRCTLLGIGPGQDGWYQERFALLSGEGERDLGVLDWADWDANGDLLLARQGRLLRLPRGSREPHEVADLRALKFEARESPPTARR